MKIITLISIILITALIGSAQTDAGKPVSDETIKLSAEAVRLFNDAKYEDAEAIAKKLSRFATRSSARIIFRLQARGGTWHISN